MSSMNFLEKLLDGVTVEWKALGDIGSFIRGNGMQKKDFVEEGFPAIHYGQIYTKYSLTASSTFSFVSNELAKKLKQAKYNDLLLATTSENDEDVVKPLAWLGSEVAISGDMMLFRHQQNVKYLAHFFKTGQFQEEKKKYITGAKVRRVSSGDLSKIKVPIPCPDNPKKSLEIQAEIVRILDAMTAHTAELTAELTARKKQYNYYRDKLLSFEDGEAEWKELGEICRFINGRAYKQPELLDSGKYPVLRVGNFFTNGNWYYSDLELDPDKYCDKGDLLYAWSASFGPRIWEGGKVIYHYHIWKILPDLNLVSKKYLYYLLAWDTEALKAESGTGSTMMHIGKGSIEKRLVPVPSLKKQAQIVSFLDKFDALTASITEGLPREIELRQKQYAYYRDLLLSFPQAQAA